MAALGFEQGNTSQYVQLIKNRLNKVELGRWLATSLAYIEDKEARFDLAYRVMLYWHQLDIDVDQYRWPDSNP